MKFNFLQSTTMEVKDNDIHYDLIEIKKFINDRLSSSNFGESIEKFNIGYEIYDFNGHMKPHPETANLKRWSIKEKSLLVVKQFDYNLLKKLSAKEQFEILKSKILEAIDDFKEFTRKPKDFHSEPFYKRMEDILNEYKNFKSF
jgi:hypothetical protein